MTVGENPSQLLLAKFEFEDMFPYTSEIGLSKFMAFSITRKIPLSENSRSKSQTNPGNSKFAIQHINYKIIKYVGI